MKSIVWFREDLRLLDNAALTFAAAQGDIIPLFIYPESLGGASYWWLHKSLESLQLDLAKSGVELIFRTGDCVQIIEDLVVETNANNVVWNRVYSPSGIADGKRVKSALNAKKVGQRSFSGQLLIEPDAVKNKQGLPFKVFTPFWRHCKQVLAPERPLDVPELTPIIEKPASEKLAEWGLIPSTPDWSQGINDRWQPGELGASERWETFLDESIDEYQQGRDFPSKPVTSYLSPHLVFGEISPRVLWHDLHDRIALGTVDADNANKFLSEIGWREYSRYLLFHFPHITESSFNKKFECFPWQNNDQLLQAWQQGNTGYPIIDAGMRELWQTGYMHNRVRMIVASFLTKHCLIHWSKGMDWFWDTLVDADIANNTASWQWIAGSGADAAPYFRIFNPILQGEKFDKEGGYVKKWVPELALLDSKYLHKPWEASPEILEQAEVELGLNYSYPIVDHKEARLRALAAYSQSKELSKFN